jgi:N-acyl-D-amino-acid deacylase
MFDVVVRGGEVLDGTGAAPVRADVGVRDRRIAAIGALDGAVAGRELDATGRYVMPGFIDAHVHADSAVLDPAVQLALLRQGITTVLLGQDGLSYAPSSPSTVDFVSWYFAAVNGAHPTFSGGRVADLLDTYDTPVNVGYLVPHGTIRYEVLGPAARSAGPEELAAMRRLVEEGLADGALGLSSGLEYAPGRYADAAELAYLCAPLGDRPYVTHMRGYETAAGVGMAEASAIGRLAGVRVHISHYHGSHYHGPAGQLIALWEETTRAGVDVSFDSYPYLRGSSTLAMAALPDWLPTADLAATTAALRDPAVRRRLLARWSDELWPRITLARVVRPDWAWTEGLTLMAAAERAGLAPAALALELLLADELQVGCVFAHPPSNSAASVEALLRHPAQVGSSDGIYQGGHPHPRGFGAFGRLLGRYVRELGVWDWAQAAVHLAGRPAARFGLVGRGLIQRGYAADLAIVDPATVADRATYAEPRQLATGIDDVLVNGTPVLASGTLTGARPGRTVP